MKTLHRLVLTVVVLGCAAVLWLGIWPGKLDVVLGPPIVIVLSIALPLACLLLLGTALEGLWRRLRRVSRPVRVSAVRVWPRRLLAIPAACFVTFVLVGAHVPERIAVSLYRQEFEQLANSIATEPDALDPSSPRRVGPYTVDAWAIDAGGGVWLSTFSAPESSMTRGFVRTPSTEGTPFGSRRDMSRLVGDWYVFCAVEEMASR